jgi:hypothetical protein
MRASLTVRCLTGACASRSSRRRRNCGWRGTPSGLRPWCLISTTVSSHRSGLSVMSPARRHVEPGRPGPRAGVEHLQLQGADHAVESRACSPGLEPDDLRLRGRLRLDLHPQVRARVDVAGVGALAHRPLEAELEHLLVRGLARRGVRIPVRAVGRKGSGLRSCADSGERTVATASPSLRCAAASVGREEFLRALSDRARPETLLAG